MAGGELGQAIGLQGRPNIPDAGRLFWEGQRFDQMEEAKKSPKIDKADDDAFNKQINDAIKVKYEDYHRTDLPIARDLVANNIKKLVEMKASGNPAWKNEAPNMFNELNFQLGKLRQASSSKFEFEKYANTGGYTDDAARKYYDYLRTNNPGYLKGIDLSRSTVLNAIDPESGAAAFTPLQPLDVNAYIRKNIYDPFKKEQLLGTENGFDRIGNAFDPQVIQAMALEQFDANPQLKANFEAQNKADILNELDKGYWKGKINQYTLQDPSFQQDYAEALEKRFVDYVASQQPVEEKLSRTPKGQNINVNVGMGGDNTDNVIESEDLEITFKDTAGNTKKSISGKSYGMEGQKILIPKGEFLTNINNGQKLTQPGAAEGVVSGIYVMPVYEDGTVLPGMNGESFNYGNTLVGEEEIKSGRAGNTLKYTYKPVAFIKIGNATYYGDAEKLTGAARYFDASDKEKPEIVRVFDKAQKDAEKRNKGISTPVSKPAPGKKKVISGF